MSNKSFSLYELNQKIKQGLEGLFPFPIWVVAEISELNVRNHCYLELVERDENTDRIIAKSRAMIWAYSFNMIKPYFETTTGYQLAAGLKVMVQVEVQYNELYGLSLSVKDIDPNYTLGDLQRRKQLILQQLKDEGILEMNKELEFPLIPKTIAIISSEKAAGYQDFMEQLKETGADYRFHTKLFPAMMQGEQATATIMDALEQIYHYEDIFDVVIIIRGGGAVSDLSCFDDYELAAHVAQFPLPILTGIGHDKDKSIVDEVAHKSLKTPTAVATYLIDCFANYETDIYEKSDYFFGLAIKNIEEKKLQLSNFNNSLKYALPASLKRTQQELSSVAKDLNYLVLEKLASHRSLQQQMQRKLQFALKYQQERSKNSLYSLQRKLVHRSNKFLIRRKETLLHKMRVAELLSPQKLLERGYSITTFNGRVIKNPNELAKGNEVIVQVAKGKIKATVK